VAVDCKVGSKIQRYIGVVINPEPERDHVTVQFLATHGKQCIHVELLDGSLRVKLLPIDIQTVHSKTIKAIISVTKSRELYIVTAMEWARVQSVNELK
jgi:hypothetical protein